jgi:hypothetical protein
MADGRHTGKAEQFSTRGRAMAGRAMPVTAAGIAYLFLPALLALPDITSQSRRTAPQWLPSRGGGSDRDGRNWPHDTLHHGGGRHPPLGRQDAPLRPAQPDGLNSDSGRISGTVSFKCSSGLATAPMVLATPGAIIRCAHISHSSALGYRFSKLAEGAIFDDLAGAGGALGGRDANRCRRAAGRADRGTMPLPERLPFAPRDSRPHGLTLEW